MNDQVSLKVCLFCGSSNLYRDYETDNMVCSDCHTQSQALSQRETTEDDAEMVGTKFSIYKSKGTRKRTLRQLPELENFIKAYFTLVEKAAERSLELLPDINIHGQNPDYKRNVIDDAKEMFLLYLERWNDAANYFMLRNPGLRISMRDRLIPHMIPRKILAQFVYNSENGENLPDTNIFQAQKVERRKGPLENLVPKRKPRTPKRVKFTNDLTESELTAANAQSTQDAQTMATSRTYSVPSKSGTKRKRKDDAKQSKSNKSKCWRSKILWIDLNPQLVNAIVYLAHLGSRTGLTTNLLVAWAKDREYDFILNSFSNLDKSQRKILNGCECSFMLNELPNPRDIDIIASILLSCFNIKNRRPGDYLRTLYLQNKAMKASIAERKRTMDIKDIKPPNGREQTFFNVGMVVLQFCMFLGLEQTVLDCTFALMGLTVHSTKEERKKLPPALNLAHPAMITSPIQILAVIAVACKFCPGWENWRVLEMFHHNRSLKVNQSSDAQSDQSDDESDDDNESEDEKGSVSSDESYCMRTRIIKSRLRIPVSEHFHNTLSSMNLMRPPDLTQIIQKSPDTQKKHMRIVAGETLDSFETINLKSRDGSMCFLACNIDLPVPWDQMQIHPSYRLLLEYIAFRLLVNVQKLFQHASLLDKELETKVVKQSATEPV